MDTVIGRRNEDKCLLTLLFRTCNFMIAILLENKTANSVISAFNMLENLLGAKKFKKMFNCILTDNGSEFKIPSKLEYNGTFKRCNIFYCNPMNSNQKAKIEKNHEYIRKIIPKGISMNKLIQDDVNLMMSHINSVARKSLDSATPYMLFVEKYGKKTVSSLNYTLISPDEIILNKKLLDNKLY